MYTAYFGLSEAPFTIAPDPAYLFMSDRHKEALAHLSHGLGDNGGFVLLTGEVGTGKTTISRTVMEQLPENTQAAFILNPTLSCDELLATICDSLKIRYKKTGATLKYLTDKIQEKLLKNHEQGLNTLVIIDEAQHLQPEVLEQLRLLTNLETNTKKLLQVILIGQPELQQLLQRRDLRQLAQRITARYHLLPLTLDELQRYIEHRLSVAQCNRSLFNKSALRTIHKISKGIPRVVNLLCDRALILAYGQNQSVVTQKVVVQAASEALGEEINTTIWTMPWFKTAASIGAIVMFLGAGIWIGSRTLPDLVKSPEHAVAVPVESTPDVTVFKHERAAANPQDITSALGTSSEIELVGDIPEPEQLPLRDTASISMPEPEPLILGHNANAYRQQQETKEFTVSPEEGVSQDLIERFREAIEETAELDAGTESNEMSPQYLPIHEMPDAIQNSLPTMSFELHMFATGGKGWVRVNGNDYSEGEEIAPGVTLENILPQLVVLSFQQQKFTMPALSNW